MDMDSALKLERKDWHEFAEKVKPETQCFIDGEFVASRNGKTFESINPATGGQKPTG